jgi:hypothetical protein
VLPHPARGERGDCRPSYGRLEHHGASEPHGAPSDARQQREVVASAAAEVEYRAGRPLERGNDDDVVRHPSQAGRGAFEQVHQAGGIGCVDDCGEPGPNVSPGRRRPIPSLRHSRRSGRRDRADRSRSRPLQSRACDRCRLGVGLSGGGSSDGHRRPRAIASHLERSAGSQTGSFARGRGGGAGRCSRLTRSRGCRCPPRAGRRPCSREARAVPSRRRRPADKRQPGMDAAGSLGRRCQSTAAGGGARGLFRSPGGASPVVECGRGGEGPRTATPAGRAPLSRNGPGPPTSGIDGFAARRRVGEGGSAPAEPKARLGLAEDVAALPAPRLYRQAGR